MTTAHVVLGTTGRGSDNVWRSVYEITASLDARSSGERYARMLTAIQRMIPCDSAALLRLRGDTLHVLASAGLVPEADGQRFVVAEHPRLTQVMRVSRPVRITDHELPDPFDGLIAGHLPLQRVHACMGCSLRDEREVVGVVVFDAMDPRAFDDVDDDAIATIAAIASAAIRTADLLEQLASDAARADRVAKDLVRDTTTRAGGELIGQSAATIALRDEVSLAGRSDLAVLITGETGVGKEVVARAIHAASARADQPLIYINCAALPESVAESELFGHVRGAFTGATDHRSGKFEVADGGTLFLDEIGELPLAMQPKLLRALQSGDIQRVGSDKMLRVDVRIIAATNRDLPAEVAAGRFRADLFHRLSVYPLHLPALRERKDDVSLLAGYFLDDARLRLGLGRVRLAPSAREALEAYDWPGNVRELEHTILRAALRASGGRRRELVVIEAVHVGLPTAAPGDASLTTSGRVAVVAPPAAVVGPLHDTVDDFKRQQISAALAQADGVWAEAARALGLDRGNLHRLAQRLGLLTPSA